MRYLDRVEGDAGHEPVGGDGLRVRVDLRDHGLRAVRLVSTSAL